MTERALFFDTLTAAQRDVWQLYKYAKLEFHDRRGDYMHDFFRDFPGAFQELCIHEWSFEQIHDPWFVVWERNTDHHMGECYEQYSTAFQKWHDLPPKVQTSITKRCVEHTLQCDPVEETKCGGKGSRLDKGSTRRSIQKFQ